MENRDWMTVHEMGDLLGLKKTGRYWLLKKNYFRTEMIHGKMYVDVKSFEDWYSKQAWYKKVTGEAPGEELKRESYSVHDIAEILQMKTDRVYFHMKKAGVEYILVDQKRRFLKKAFDEWYQNQDRYQNKKAREESAELIEASMTMPEAARALGVTRQTIYNILNNKQNSLKTFTVAGKRRILKEDFLEWYSKQTVYKMADELPEEDTEEDSRLYKFRKAKELKKRKRRYSGNQFSLTIDEAAYLAQVSHQTVSKWISRGLFPVIRFQRSVRISKAEFEEWLEERNRGHGINSRT